MAPKSRFIDRLNFAWNPIADCLSIKLWGGATVAEIIASLFDWQDRLERAGFRHVATAKDINFIAYGAFTVFALRAIFLIAENCGRARFFLEEAERKIADHVSALDCIHSVIHTTRDDLLSSDNFPKLVAMDDQAATYCLHRTWNTQLALFQRSMRGLTASECHVCIKGLKKGAMPDGKDGLESICYGPAVLAERRQHSRILPLDLGIAAEAVATRGIAHSPDILNDDRFWPRQERQESSKVYRTVVAAPILCNSTLVGVLCLDWKERGCYDHARLGNIVASFTDMIGTAYYLYTLSRVLKNLPDKP